VTLRVVGAGIGRTGTMSLKLALEKLLGGPCYHMLEVFPRPDHVGIWHGAIRGEDIDWESLFDGFVASVDWPSGAFWREQAEAFPEAVILLSTRESADAWLRSCDRTIFEMFRHGPQEGMGKWYAMVGDLLRERFSKNVLDPEEAKGAYERWNADVRANADPSRLVDWQPGDGWGPICEALGVAVPDEPFPHTNTTEEFRARAGWT
jgi:hypothetical protein